MRKFLLSFLVMASFQAFAVWDHSVAEDKMGRGSDEVASTESLSELSLNPPYEGKQKATLAFRRLGKGGNELVLSIQKGQIVCESPECMVLIRINSEEPFRIAMSHPKDGSPNFLIGSLKTEELRKFKAAEKVAAELTVFQNGESVVEFDTRDNPFKGRTVYTLSELDEKLKANKEIPTIKNGEIKIGEGGFEICRKTLKETAGDGDIHFVSKNTKDEFVTENYSESSRMVTSCKKGAKHILMEIYEYK